MINKSEVIRYLGYKENKIDEITENKLESIIKEVESQIIGKYTFKEYAVHNKTKNYVRLKNSNIILEGTDIANHLKDSNRVFILASTLGVEAERYIIRKNYISAVEGLIADAVLSDLTEFYTDECQSEIEKLIKKDEKMTFRYSPGYGNLKLNVQKQIIEELNTSRIIGLNITDTLILTPRKSVIAIIGIENINSKPKNTHQCGIDSCENCKLYNTCNFKKISK